jgi:hypothetical protein
MLLHSATIAAVLRWVRLLRASTVADAAKILRADSAYTDLTQTQYAVALDWLTARGLIVQDAGTSTLEAAFSGLPAAETCQFLFECFIESGSPPWLQDADALVADPDDLPQDALELALSLGLSEQLAFSTVRQLQGKIDLARRELVGKAGELELVKRLEAAWPGSTNHVSLASDGFGYDIAFEHLGKTWHIEVKATTRRGRLGIYLSRNEYEVSRRDPYWRLIVVGLDNKLQLQVVATLKRSVIWSRSPRDVVSNANWQSASYQLNPGDLRRGLILEAEVLERERGRDGSLLKFEAAAVQNDFSWFPKSTKT